MHFTSQYITDTLTSDNADKNNPVVKLHTYYIQHRTFSIYCILQCWDSLAQTVMATVRLAVKLRKNDG